jgi:Asp-tRNA(Asn)/Glu-tRNA(Gln) amidotransferase A subunit family amidase
VKPSSGRLPYHLLKGYLTPGAESVGILCVNGVIAVSMRDCDLLLRSVAEAEPWLSDPGCSYLPWEKREVPSHPLAFGVIREDHESTMLPPVRRALEETCEKLRAAGHEIIELGEFYRSAELTQNAQNLFKIEGGKVGSLYIIFFFFFFFLPLLRGILNIANKW